MPTKDRKAALGNSLKAEEEAVQSRFERAETALARNDFSQAPDAAALPHPAAKPRLVEDEPRVKRDSFTMPLSDYEQIEALQKKCLKAQTRASKSEILRAGLMALAALSEDELARVVDELPKVKTGRPPSSPVASGK